MCGTLGIPNANESQHEPNVRTTVGNDAAAATAAAGASGSIGRRDERKEE